MKSFCLTVAGIKNALDDAHLLKFMKPPSDAAVFKKVVTDLGNVEPGCLFLAYRGVHFDAHQNIEAAIKGGAAFVVMDDPAFQDGCTVPYALVTNSRAAGTHLMAEGYGHPEKQMTFIGITGTNGKTSVAFIVKELLRLKGQPSLLLGTLGTFMGDVHVTGAHTTPDPPQLFLDLASAVERGIRYCVMEVSSHALSQHKIGPIRFFGGAFTSFSRDHLDFHGSMEEYFEAKLSLARLMKNQSVFLVSSSLEEVRTKAILSAQPDAIVYGQQSSKVANLGIRYDAREGPVGSILRVQQGQGVREGQIKFLEDFASANFVAALALAEWALGEAIAPELWSQVRPVPGRLEPVDLAGTVIVDYAHTPDALEKTLMIVKPRVQGRLWVVFGCGGDRDRGKRALMGEVAATHGDRVVVTSDNPRSENPKAIMDDIKKGLDGFGGVTYIEDRREAIRHAVTQKDGKDWVVIAGKGHEDYQTIQGQDFPFDDREIAREFLTKD